jgi:hypothetical protein
LPNNLFCPVDQIQFFSGKMRHLFLTTLGGYGIKSLE